MKRLFLCTFVLFLCTVLNAFEITPGRFSGGTITNPLQGLTGSFSGNVTVSSLTVKSDGFSVGGSTLGVSLGRLGFGVAPGANGYPIDMEANFAADDFMYLHNLSANGGGVFLAAGMSSTKKTLTIASFGGNKYADFRGNHQINLGLTTATNTSTATVNVNGQLNVIPGTDSTYVVSITSNNGSTNFISVNAKTGAILFTVKTSAELGLMTPTTLGECFRNSNDSYIMYHASGTGLGQWASDVDPTKGPTLP